MSLSTQSTEKIQKRLIEIMAKPSYRPLKAHELSARLRVHPKDRKSFRSLVRRMEREGTVVRLRKNSYVLAGRDTVATGTLSVHAHGFGFLRRDDLPADAEHEDVFVPKSAMGGARNGDRVRVTVSVMPDEKTEGRVTEILDRASVVVVGTLVRRGGDWQILPDDQRLGRSIRVRGFADGLKGMKHHKVVANLQEPAREGAKPMAFVTENLGASDDVGVDVLGIMRQYDLREEFSKAALREADRMKPGFGDKEITTRRDFRGWHCFTIDPEEARDHDDALSIKKLKNGNWLLGVHIADVAHYVRPGSAIDTEARHRGFSAYLVDRVVTMLPKRLTTDLCSLVPHKDRFTHSVLLEFTPKGEVVSQDTSPGIIHSRARLSYELVQAYFDDGNTKGINKKSQAALDGLRELTRVLRGNRVKDGAIEFSVPEVRCQLRKDGQIRKIVKRIPIEAYALVEECMLAANRAVAEILTRPRRPCVYRVHEEPTEEQWGRMAEELASLGIQNPPMSRADIAEVMRQQKKPGLKYPTVLAMLKNMQRAEYTEKRGEHFGLAFSHYTHFTSPIRRYPDLIVHRLLKTLEKNQPAPESRDDLATLCQHCSERERNAEQAEKETVKVKLLAHYHKKLLSGKGEVYPATITAIKTRGMIVELQESLFTGLIPFMRIEGDYFETDENGFRAVGRKSRRVFKLGDSVKVMIIKVDREQKQIDFALVED